MMEAVKGLRGRWHLSDGSWDKSGNKLNTYCQTSISPNFRRFNHVRIDCPKCQNKLGGGIFVKDARVSGDKR